MEITTQINKIWSILGISPATKRNDVLMHATVWIVQKHLQGKKPVTQNTSCTTHSYELWSRERAVGIGSGFVFPAGLGRGLVANGRTGPCGVMGMC
jgi:hypothetical protein